MQSSGLRLTSREEAVECIHICNPEEERVNLTANFLGGETDAFGYIHGRETHKGTDRDTLPGQRFAFVLELEQPLKKKKN